MTDAGDNDAHPVVDSGAMTDAPAADTAMPDTGVDAPAMNDATADVPAMNDATTDVPAMSDTGSDGASADVPSTPDSGGRVDAGSVCPPNGTGEACSDTTMCPSGFTCDLGRCMPQGRQTCGGFAMARCTDAAYSECLYETGHGDVGTCFSPSERTCLCAVAADRWQCR
jgi:hypothetical protein